MAFLRNLLKTLFLIVRYLVIGINQRVLQKNTPDHLRRLELANTARHAIAVLKLLNVEIEVKSGRKDLFQQNYFMVCNHMSYLDILILSSLRQSVFVTSVEMEKTFFLGDMAKLGGSFFVDRVNRRKIKAEVGALKGILAQGFNLFIFPEGTSTDGQEILPFKKSLFRVPKETGSKILPICLRYETVDGEPFSRQNCDKICWYGDMSFFPHFLGLMSLKQLKVKVQYLDPLDPADFEDHGSLAAAAETTIRAAYAPAKGMN